MAHSRFTLIPVTPYPSAVDPRCRAGLISGLADPGTLMETFPESGCVSCVPVHMTMCPNAKEPNIRTCRGRTPASRCPTRCLAL